MELPLRQIETSAIILLTFFACCCTTTLPVEIPISIVNVALAVEPLQGMNLTNSIGEDHEIVSHIKNNRTRHVSDIKSNRTKDAWAMLQRKWPVREKKLNANSVRGNQLSISGNGTRSQGNRRSFLNSEKSSLDSIRAYPALYTTEPESFFSTETEPSTSSNYPGQSKHPYTTDAEVVFTTEPESITSQLSQTSSSFVGSATTSSAASSQEVSTMQPEVTATAIEYSTEPGFDFTTPPELETTPPEVGTAPFESSSAVPDKSEPFSSGPSLTTAAEQPQSTAGFQNSTQQPEIPSSGVIATSSLAATFEATVQPFTTRPDLSSATGGETNITNPFNGSQYEITFTINMKLNESQFDEKTGNYRDAVAETAGCDVCADDPEAATCGNCTIDSSVTAEQTVRRRLLSASIDITTYIRTLTSDLQELQIILGRLTLEALIRNLLLNGLPACIFVVPPTIILITKEYQNTTNNTNTTPEILASTSRSNPPGFNDTSIHNIISTQQFFASTSRSNQPRENNTTIKAVSGSISQVIPSENVTAFTTFVANFSDLTSSISTTTQSTYDPYLAGLGNVTILFGPIDFGPPPLNATTIYQLPKPFDAIEIIVPAGSWPSSQSKVPLSVTVFTFTGNSSTPGELCGPAIDLQPHQMQLAGPLFLITQCTHGQDNAEHSIFEYEPRRRWTQEVSEDEAFAGGSMITSPVHNLSVYAAFSVPRLSTSDNGWRVMLPVVVIVVIFVIAVIALVTWFRWLRRALATPSSALPSPLHNDASDVSMVAIVDVHGRSGSIAHLEFPAFPCAQKTAPAPVMVGASNQVHRRIFPLKAKAEADLVYPEWFQSSQSCAVAYMQPDSSGVKSPGLQDSRIVRRRSRLKENDAELTADVGYSSSDHRRAEEQWMSLPTLNDFSRPIALSGVRCELRHQRLVSTASPIGPAELDYSRYDCTQIITHSGEHILPGGSSPSLRQRRRSSLIRSARPPALEPSNSLTDQSGLHLLDRDISSSRPASGRMSSLTADIVTSSDARWQRRLHSGQRTFFEASADARWQRRLHSGQRTFFEASGSDSAQRSQVARPHDLGRSPASRLNSPNQRFHADVVFINR